VTIDTNVVINACKNLSWDHLNRALAKAEVHRLHEGKVGLDSTRRSGSP
jgi:hypothetical protein